MNNSANSAASIIEYYSTADKNKSLKHKLFTAYLNEHLISSTGFEDKSSRKEPFNSFDNTDLFYLLSLAEKLPAYGVGFSDEHSDVN